MTAEQSAMEAVQEWFYANIPNSHSVSHLRKIESLAALLTTTANAAIERAAELAERCDLNSGSQIARDIRALKGPQHG